MESDSSRVRLFRMVVVWSKGITEAPIFQSRSMLKRQQSTTSKHQKNHQETKADDAVDVKLQSAIERMALCTFRFHKQVH